MFSYDLDRMSEAELREAISVEMYEREKRDMDCVMRLYAAVIARTRPLKRKLLAYVLPSN